MNEPETTKQREARLGAAHRHATQAMRRLIDARDLLSPETEPDTIAQVTRMIDETAGILEWLALISEPVKG